MARKLNKPFEDSLDRIVGIDEDDLATMMLKLKKVMKDREDSLLRVHKAVIQLMKDLGKDMKSGGVRDKTNKDTG